MRTPKTVAITGAARGIGRATAVEFLKSGADIAIGDLDLELAEKTATELTSAYPGRRVIARRLNVVDAQSMADFLDAAVSEFGSLDVVINNAGIMPTNIFAEESDEVTNQTVDVNLRGVLNGTKAALSRLSPNGVIVNISSQVTNLPAPALTTYTATKCAVLGLNDALSRELDATGSTIKLMAVQPGIVRTELSAGSAHLPFLEPLVVTDPERVAAGIVEGVRRGRRRVAVPKPLGIIAAGLHALPYPVGRFIERTLGLDKTFTNADPEARKRYHDRIEQAHQDS
ncbi:SDR family NAD(P)-dependent oxidoreductase [Corynebacterium sp. TAE3-ERU12]|uniref:SDR family NAD(P)-dependent oxidoreductase n=1 Tax=Corynebacterium sp. TAE3-ERU12 TaxID=2849491 RepID=UPI001C47CA1E|nr:SDR family NAD(P)-dependent oxidoreductase [Corynebacterium sp. TAE3-ERU12]